MKFLRRAGIAYLVPAMILMVVCLVRTPIAGAQDTASARDITGHTYARVTGSSADPGYLTDTSLSTRWETSAIATIELESPLGIGAVYLEWETLPLNWTIALFGRSSFEQEKVYGQSGFLNEYVATDRSVRKIRITVTPGSKPASIARLRVFTKGTPAESVQRWLPPLSKADLLVLPTHADDEHLYFGGTLPTYAGEQKKKVQVAYLVNHGIPRTRELLAGLWVAGVTVYPVLSEFPDRYAANYADALRVYSEPEVLDYQVMLLRRFRPEVVVGHDLDGEYGHGMHIMNAKTLTEALTLAADPGYDPDSVDRFGVWEVKKCYLHLYEENRVEMDWLLPLASFGGRTSWEMAKLAYDEHVSQHVFKFRVRIEGPNDCRQFGLYHTTVGPDVTKKDFFENIPPDATPSPFPASSDTGSTTSDSSAFLSSVPGSTGETPSDQQSLPPDEASDAHEGSLTSQQGPWTDRIAEYPWIVVASIVLLLLAVTARGIHRRRASTRTHRRHR
jgi:LmbE family N-acetylglucosaminyl deacetylase